MGYVEYLRARHAFTVFAIVLTACIAFTDFSILYGIHNAHVEHSSANRDTTYTISVAPGSKAHGKAADDEDSVPISLADKDFTVPIGMLFGVAAYLAMVLATILGTSLNKENSRGGFAFTKPISRERLALTFIGIDLAAIVAAFSFTVLLGLASLEVLGIFGKLALEPGAAAVAAVGLGAAVMWYGLLQAATSMRVAGGGLFVGLSWVLFFIMLPFYAITFLGPIFHGLIVAIDFFNPLAYFALVSHDDIVTTISLLGFSPGTCIAITWSLATAACIAAIYGWKRVEV
jgi:hypothetical protein